MLCFRDQFHSTARFQLLWDILEVFGRFNVDHAASLACAAHKFLRTGVQHSHGGVASVGEVVDKDVWDRQTAIRLKNGGAISSRPRGSEVAAQ